MRHPLAQDYTVIEENERSPFHQESMMKTDECIFKKCCKKYKRKGKHCRKCPKL